MAFQLVRIILLSTFAFAVALALSKVFLLLMARFRIGKQIRNEGAPIFFSLHRHKEKTPTMGGAIIWVTTIITVFVFAFIAVILDQSFSAFNFLSRSQTLLPLGAFIASAFIGLADDWLGVLKIGPNGGGFRIRDKLIVYTVVAAIGAWWFAFKLDFSVINIPFLGAVDLGFWYIPFFIFILVATAFSVNETDGLDGLAGGVILLALGSYGVISFMLSRFDLAALIGVILGATLAFLWNNIWPARFFMGDTGSMSLGIMLGIMAMFTAQPILLIFFGLILILESLSVIIQLISKKFRKGKKVFKSTPLHHHFEALGWPESQVTMRFWIISAFASGLGLVIFFADRFKIFF